MYGNENKVNDMIVDAVQYAINDFKNIFEKFNLTKVNFSLHEDIDFISAVFNNDNNECAWCNITEVVIAESGEWFTIMGEDSDGRLWSGYLDKHYGEYFDVAQSIGQIYQAIVHIANEDGFKDIEKK